MFVVNGEWYLEYQIHNNRPGLLGDIASILGAHSMNILTINGVDDHKRGMLIHTDACQKIESLQRALSELDHITLTALRSPKLTDRVAVRHGRYLDDCEVNQQVFRFVRDELGMMIDFLAELLKVKGNRWIGVRGMPRVGKSESIVAASVCANKKWTFVSSTLLKQTLRTELTQEEFLDCDVFIIDGIISARCMNERHDLLIHELLRGDTIKVIEHPDVFTSNNEFTMDHFEYIIELRNDPDEVITYDTLELHHKEF